MLRTQKKGLGDSIWASRGRPSNFYNSPSSNSSSTASYTRSTPKSTSIVTPATPPSSTGSRSPMKQLGPANRTTNGATATQSKPPSQQEFKRYIQIVRRMKWKLPFLSHAYHSAIAMPGDPLWAGETNAAEAELMFKLDFYEYYMLLERAIVHLLSVFGVTVSKDKDRRWGGGGGPGAASTHAFHENVIAALEVRDNPLHEALGTGEVLFSLYRAKELRNRWKYAELQAGGNNGAQGQQQRERSGTAPLESYDLDRIFREVFAGFDAGYAVAERKVAGDVGVLDLAGGVEMMEIEEDEFDFMVEAMDWEAV
ncbi:hypothetical protein CMUS01_06381 [Colletotrichum musicola]|uniref:Fungal specific transcription factor n=1 Tax=Colletotrichum musicola TaxID=2175873 RepID=A0A8H6KN85_9PEZI|nr:hypothetical protein CMUS01_06381 [Colletotrichum musicola]